MTSKDKLIYIDELLQKTYSDTINYSVITSNIEDILIDLDRLEKLEKEFKNLICTLGIITYADMGHYFIKLNKSRQGINISITYEILEELYRCIKENKYNE